MVELTEATAEVTVLGMMEAQRAEHPDHIGGFAQMTTVSTEGIRQRLARRWEAPPQNGEGRGSAPVTGRPFVSKFAGDRCGRGGTADRRPSDPRSDAQQILAALGRIVLSKHEFVRDLRRERRYDGAVQHAAPH